MEAARNPFAAAVLREKHLVERLEAAPLLELAGVVGPSGAAGAKSGGDVRWSLRLTFDRWRVVGGALGDKELALHRKVTNDELTTLQRTAAPYAVLRVRARVIVDPDSGKADALLGEVLGPDNSDAELNARAAELQRPVTHDDPAFGTLTLDRRVNWYEGETMWNGLPVRLSLSVGEPPDLAGALRTARELWADQAGWNRRIRDYAIAELLPLKNDTWLDENEAELTATEFERRMTLESITVQADGAFDFWHSDGDLFLGHAIQVGGTLADGPTRADIPG